MKPNENCRAEKYKNQSSLAWINSRVQTTEERTYEVEDRAIEIIQTKEKGKKKEYN